LKLAISDNGSKWSPTTCGECGAVKVPCIVFKAENCRCEAYVCEPCLVKAAAMILDYAELQHAHPR
jgi:hypothetical protein